MLHGHSSASPLSACHILSHLGTFLQLRPCRTFPTNVAQLCSANDWTPGKDSWSCVEQERSARPGLSFSWYDQKLMSCLKHGQMEDFMRYSYLVANMDVCPEHGRVSSGQPWKTLLNQGCKQCQQRHSQDLTSALA